MDHSLGTTALGRKVTVFSRNVFHASDHVIENLADFLGTFRVKS